MSLDTTGPTWGAPEPGQPRWGRRQTVLAVGVAAVIAALGGATIYAATDGGSSAGGPASHGMPGVNPPPWSNGGPPGVNPAPELHGEFVLQQGAGGFITVVGREPTARRWPPASARSEIKPWAAVPR
ncbi:hypothetical protein [Mycobacterium sp. 1164985.4]|uniref:hypothetical protein n=1 Tax=Mycobacterium sp. 1164985.4 TaxID=1834069 RepID=UPI0008010871|nr:hypothetical protein [Mycobacterium sp. 1164985.4]OBK75579.1 hypothetical protein A5650_17485 [Mycobacterium sp. 1164985.4]